MLTPPSAAEDIGVPDATPMLTMPNETGRHVIRCPFDAALPHIGQQQTRSVGHGDWDEGKNRDEYGDSDEIEKSDEVNYGDAFDDRDEDEEGNKDDNSNE